MLSERAPARRRVRRACRGPWDARLSYLIDVARVQLEAAEAAGDETVAAIFGRAVDELEATAFGVVDRVGTTS